LHLKDSIRRLQDDNIQRLPRMHNFEGWKGNTDCLSMEELDLLMLMLNGVHALRAKTVFAIQEIV
jgi:hypothetical protein